MAEECPFPPFPVADDIARLPLLGNQNQKDWTNDNEVALLDIYLRNNNIAKWCDGL